MRRSAFAGVTSSRSTPTAHLSLREPSRDIIAHRMTVIRLPMGERNCRSLRSTGYWRGFAGAEVALLSGLA